MTIFGAHTVGELQDLVNNWDGIVATLKQKGTDFLATWQSHDYAAWADWQGDFDKFFARWTTARNNAQAVLDTNPSLRDITPAEGPYQEILHALTVNPGAWQKGDFDDLNNRVSAALAATNQPPLTYTVVQPSAGDVDLSAFKSADAAARQITATATAVADTAKQAGKSAAMAVVPYVVGGVAAVGVTAWLAKKFIPGL